MSALFNAFSAKIAVSICSFLVAAAGSPDEVVNRQVLQDAYPQANVADPHHRLGAWGGIYRHYGDALDGQGRYDGSGRRRGHRGRRRQGEEEIGQDIDMRRGREGMVR